ncbi:porin [Marinospirillum alkaliphilum]|uniref:Outer membrane protein (Porin) n=1 Tax=Marinospirillum alkaliphilum DSM 21637 TaxID=1122209 RepID=A0A1K1V7B4_9GAMM|nr:porin [Marinospirillum alkaliphilum]SFX21026.1 Outer membrane protein (porin) [Marinospirillum alkaliphilum DSM 21637]
MMKKTLLASAVAATLATTGAQAANIIDQDGTKVDVYGRLQMELYNNGTVNQIQDNGSRIGFRASHKETENLTVFANLEFRFKPDEASGQNITPRNSFFGAQGDWGKFWVGNFDSIYFDYVSGRIELQQRDGVDYTSGSKNGRADSLAYEYKAGDLKFAVMAKHYVDVAAEEEAFNLQAAVSFNLGDLNLAVAFDQNSDEDAVGGTGNARIGVGATYKLDALTAHALAEMEDGETRFALGAKYNLGVSDVYAAFSVTSEDFEAEGKYTDLESAILVGATYKFSKPMFAYAEVAAGDKYEDSTFTVGARYSW